MTLSERCQQRVLQPTVGQFAVYKGAEHDLYIALPDEEKLQRVFEIYFDVRGLVTPVIIFHKKRYLLNEPPLRTEDRGYYCIQGKYRGSKGLHKIPLHRLAYIAFYGTPPPGYHIHHIDKNKHNNSAANLVALTEQEHCEVHKRDVSVPRNLFTKTKPKGLFTALAEEAKQSIKQVDDLSLSQIEESIKEPKILQLLLADYSEENLNKLLEAVTAVQLYEEPTVLEYICSFVQQMRRS